MKRRHALLSLIALGFSASVAKAQPANKVWRLGYLSSASGPDELLEGAFLQELRRLGYIEGGNVQIEYRWGGGSTERLQKLASELVRLKVDVIVAGPTNAALAAKNATSTIPIVISTADPVGAGLVASLARPGGNVTGVAANSTEIAAKRLQLLREAVPKAARIALLVSNSVAGKLMVTEMRAAAKQMGFALVVQEHPATTDGLAAAFAAMQSERAQALIVQQGAFTTENRKQIADLARKMRLPSMFESRGPVDAGGFMSYGTNQSGLRRRVAHYVDLILKGAKPAELPVELPTKLEMVINLKTAKALGVNIPRALQLQADEVLQ
jgi:putative ABC transport system substrate-binding protein